MADAVTPRDWRKKRSINSSTSHLHLPGELADILAEMAQQIASQNVRMVQRENEIASLRGELKALTNALAEGLEIKGRAA